MRHRERPAPCCVCTSPTRPSERTHYDGPPARCALGHGVVSFLGCPLWLKSWLPPRERSKLEPLGRISGLGFTHPLHPGGGPRAVPSADNTHRGPSSRLDISLGTGPAPGVHDGHLGPVLGDPWHVTWPHTSEASYEVSPSPGPRSLRPGPTKTGARFCASRLGSVALF